MKEVYLVRPYCDAFPEVFETFSAAWLRKCAMEKEYGDSVLMDTVPIEESRHKPIRLPDYGPSPVQQLGTRRRRA